MIWVCLVNYHLSTFSKLSEPQEILILIIQQDVPACPLKMYIEQCMTGETYDSFHSVFLYKILKQKMFKKNLI